MAPLLFMTAIFLFNFMARFIWAPLMVAIEEDLGLRHTGAGSLFFTMSVGYCLGLLASGYFSKRLSHVRTISLSSLSCGVALALTFFAGSVPALALSLLMVGITAGIYLPSAIPTLTYRLGMKDYGKAYSFHEVSPSLCFILGPILAEVMLSRFRWNAVLLPVAASLFLLGIFNLVKPIAGREYGEAPSASSIARVLSQKEYWALLVLFMLCAGTNVGIYSMLPLYLQAGRGMDQSAANTLLAFSRVAAVFSPLLVGWAGDRFGPRRALAVIVFLNGIATGLLGADSEPLFRCALFIQPMLSTASFPPIWTLLSGIVSPGARNLGVSLIVPPAFVMGGGILPTVIGAFGDAGLFPAGFLLWGAVTFLSVLLVRHTGRQSSAAGIAG